MSFTKSRFPYVVLDKNMVGFGGAAEAKRHALAAQSSLLVIDTSFAEQVRTPDWATHFKRDFNNWIGDEVMLSVSIGLGEALRAERDAGKPLDRIDDPEMTKETREVMKESNAGDDSRLVPASRHAALLQPILQAGGGRIDPESRYKQLRGCVDWYFDHPGQKLKDVFKEDIKNGTVLRSIAVLVVSETMSRRIEDTLKLVGYSADASANLATSPSFTYCYIAALEAYSLQLFLQGNRLPETVNKEKLLNQIIDLEYITYGLCCQGLLTLEPNVAEIEKHLRGAMTEKWG